MEGDIDMDKKKFLLCWGLITLALLAGALLPAVRAAELDLPVPSYVLMERSTGQVLLGHNAHELPVPGRRHC